MLRRVRARSAARKEGRSRRERGAAALEFALVAPLFFFVMFGGIEVGLMFRSNLTLSDAARNGARVGSIERSSAEADRAIITRIYNQSQNLNGDIKRIVIYKADTMASSVPDDCKTGASKAGVCNVYVTAEGGGGDDLKAISEGGGTLQTGYDSADRLKLTNIGIWIEYEYSYVTGFFDSTTLTAESVEVIELDL